MKFWSVLDCLKEKSGCVGESHCEGYCVSIMLGYRNEYVAPTCCLVRIVEPVLVTCSVLSLEG
jgi:hypothetical protein